MNEEETVGTVSTAVLDDALHRARQNRLRLFVIERGLFASAACLGLLVGVRGVVALVAPSEVRLVGLGVANGIALLVAGVSFVVALRIRARSERTMRDVQVLELARDAADRDPMPRVELRPYRAESRPVVVVRTDDVERPFRERDRPRSSSSIARPLAAIAVVAALLFFGAALFGGGKSGHHRWTFIDDMPGLTASTDDRGTWAIEADDVAVGARSLVNRAGDDSAPPAVLVASSVTGRDVRAVTRCRTDGACGLVFRYLDDANHHLVRFEVGDARVVLARVSHGGETILATADAPAVRTGVWQELGVEARGDAIRVALNGIATIDTNDILPSPAGSIGLWVPSTDEAFFDDLSIDVFAASPQAVELLPLLQKPSSG